MTLRIISADDILFEGEVTAVHLPGTQGAFTVLRNHASLVSTLTRGRVVYVTPDGNEEAVDISGGIADIDNNVVAVCII
ncbi:MAG: ATP synthase F1 subunit epsilon [Paramuribaculum sp.]|nr:ATP synthase F1 subunit epsilon [Candidatus Amulumruptor sp.]MDE6588211.1 ATP synthase F1 subunit epsilon [Paramuribaculum sp.]MDE7152540.1 ATP synthase F1 subunit epsilon [Candidatus Amulumruptor sp.]